MRSLRDARLKTGITQAMLSEQTGISQQYVSKIELGRNKPTQSTRERIENVLGYPIDWISTEPLIIRDSSYYKAERLLKRLIEVSISMEASQKKAFNELVHKYFN